MWALQALRRLDAQRKAILLPAYLCPSVAQPLREAGADIIFYSVSQDLQIDLDDLRSRIGPEVLAVLIIHYFGLPQPQGVFDLLSSCDPPIWVIEDMAHAWLSRSADGLPLGRRGTVAVFSPRKFFPVPDGAMAIVVDASTPLDAEVMPVDWTYMLQRTAGLFLRRLYARTGAEPVNRLAFNLLHRAERDLDGSISTSTASWISRRILGNLDYKTAIEQRRRNYQHLLQGMQRMQLLVQPLYDQLPPGVTPLGFPITCDRRDDLRLCLIQRRIYPPIHWPLPQNEAVERFDHLVDLSQRILTLPIDQRYGAEDMEYILDSMTRWKSGTRHS
jgi:dTDP-4-amino-4,6-dideoxygalactose transaminase